VEGLRQDVTVIVTSYLNTAWYTKQLRELTRPCPEGVEAAQAPTRIICQRPYVPDGRAAYTSAPDTLPEGTAALVLDAPVRPPTRAILDLDDATIDRTAQSYVPLDQSRVLQMGDVQARLQAGMLLYPWHQFGLAIINTSLGERPIHFASSGNAASALGLNGYLVRQGLAHKVHEGPMPETAPEGVVPMPPDSPLMSVTGRWLDAPRTETLFEEVFVHRGGIPDWDHWPDQSTIGIPNYYAWGYYALAQAAYQQYEDARAEAFQAEADRWSTLGN
jgi:hypothetical protein